MAQVISNFIYSVFLFSLAIVTFPLRFVYEFLTISHPDLFRTSNNPKKHKAKVEGIQAQIRKWNENGRQGTLCSSRPSWQKITITDFKKSKLNQIDVDIGDIVSIDESNKVLTVEPRMKMGTLTQKLLRKGWTIPIVPELDELTVGGLICGAGLETSSHKYGLFHNTCLSYEVVLADGRCINCSETENPDLFYAIPMSYGTLGFLTAVQIPLIPAKPYVKLEYVPVTGVDKAMELLHESSHEFVEGLQFSKDQFVIMYGDFADFAPKDKIRTFRYWWDQLFHSDTETFLSKPSGQIQYIPTRDYYHRYSRAYFWIFAQILTLYKYFLFRLFFGWCLPLNFAIFKLVIGTITFGYFGDFVMWMLDKVNFVLQDYVVPVQKVPELLNMVDKDLGVYPIWLCPVRFGKSNVTTLPSSQADGKHLLYVDVGVYGYSKNIVKNIKNLWVKYEQFTVRNKGIIGFYTETYLSREEFNEMFNPTIYMKARKKYGCEDAFPLVYDKVSQSARKAA